MGITGLKQPLLEYLKKKQYSDSIDSLRNLVLGVDLSIWLNLAIQGSDNRKVVARQFSCSPRQDSSQYIRKFLSKAFTFLKEYAIEIVLVADGCGVERNNDLIKFLSKGDKFGNIILLEEKETPYFNNKKQLIVLQYFLSLHYDENHQVLKSEKELFETLMGFYKIHVLRIKLYPQWNNASLERFKTAQFQKQMQKA